MSSPVEKRKAELQAMLRFDEDAAQEAGMIEFKRCTELFSGNPDWIAMFRAGASWQHAKTAKIAQDFLDALEVVEKIANETGMHYSIVGKWSKDVANETLAKLSKGDE